MLAVAGRQPDAGALRPDYRRRRAHARPVDRIRWNAFGIRRFVLTDRRDGDERHVAVRIGDVALMLTDCMAWSAVAAIDTTLATADVQTGAASSEK